MAKHHVKIMLSDVSIQQVTIDPVYGCIYLRFSNEPVAKTLEHGPEVNLDLDKDSNVVGIEILGARKAAHTLKEMFSGLAKDFNEPALERIPEELVRSVEPLSA